MAEYSTSGLSEDHKAALAEGRAQGRSVRRYLEALDAHRPRRGRKRTPDSMRRRLKRIEQELLEADPLKRLQLVQERIDLAQEITASEHKVNLDALEKDFLVAARSYSQRKGITYAAWRELGVPAATLKKAGISRAGG
ncbi:MAG: hypothetical protein ACKVWR_19220 [Acidimicrobiales bacterium]